MFGQLELPPHSSQPYGFSHMCLLCMRLSKFHFCELRLDHTHCRRTASHQRGFSSGLGTTYADAHRRKAIQMQRVWLTEYTEQSPHTAYWWFHTGGKEFMCDKCNKQFRHSSTLSKHLKIHAGVKPCACSACDYRSSQKWNLDSRLQSRHMCEKPYGCDECDSNLSVQGNDFSRPCDSKLEIKPNRLSHILHLYGFSPVGCQRHHSRP